MREDLKALIKANPCQHIGNGTYITCPVRLSYPHLFEKTHYKGDKTKPGQYSVALLFPHPDDIGADFGMGLLAAAAKAVADAKFPGELVEMPFRNQGERKGDGYKLGGVFMNVTSKERRPQIVGRDLQPITDTSKVYPGVWARVTINPYARDMPKKGVSFGLQNIMLVADDDPLAGPEPAAAQFQAIGPLVGGAVPAAADPMAAMRAMLGG
jgi:hypothetical protein